MQVLEHRQKSCECKILFNKKEKFDVITLCIKGRNLEQKITSNFRTDSQNK